MPGCVPANWRIHLANGIEYYESQPAPGFVIAFTTRKGGVSRGPYDSLNLSLQVGDEEHAVRENLRRVRHALGITTLFTMNQIHSARVVFFAEPDKQEKQQEADAAFTDLPGIGLGIKVADCLPVYIWSCKPPVVGLAHCGWRGTATRLAEKLAQQMSERFSVPLPRLHFALGPCICADCYVVGEDVAAEFRQQFPSADRFLRPAEQQEVSESQRFDPLNPRTLGPWNHFRLHLDLRSANRSLLAELGLVEAGSLDLCTKENPEHFYSVRRDGTAGRNLAAIVLRRAKW